MTLASRLSAGAGLLERGAELRSVEEALARARSGGGRLVVIEGEAGIGKSTLIDVVAERARATGLWLVRSTASELEREYPFGVAIDLFGPLLRELAWSREALFNGPAAGTAPLFDPSGNTDDPRTGDPFATVHGLYWLAVNAAEMTPLLVAVDDAQWADEASLRFLHYLGQRVGELPITLLISFRSGEMPSDTEPGHLLLADRSALHLGLGPLSESAVGELLVASGEDVEDGDLRHACWEASGGNPFLVSELIQELRVGGLRRDRGGVANIAALVPERVSRFVEARIRRLDAPAQRFAEAVAVLGEEADLRRVVVLAGVGEDEAAHLVRDLTRMAILAPNAPLAFAHPIVRSAVYRLIPDVLRARLHRDAARLLHRDNAALGLVASQLMASDRIGDREVVDVLVDAARQARARGNGMVAVHHLRRALAEPPARDQRGMVVLELARAEATIGEPAAIAHFDEALGQTDDPQRRASLLLELGHALTQAADLGSAADAFRRGIDELEDTDDILRRRLEAGLVATAWLGMTHGPMAEQIGDRVLREPVLGPGHRELAMSIAFQRSISGTATSSEMVTLVNRGLAEAPIEVLVTEGQLIELATGVLFSTDELDAEIDLLTRAIDAIQAAGSFAKLGLYSVARAWPNYVSGRLSDAIADAQAGLRASELGWETFYPGACAYGGMAEIERADLPAAERMLSPDPGRWSQRADWILVLIARGRLFAARGDQRKAATELRAAGEFASIVGYRNPGPPEWRTWLVEVLTRVQEHDQARHLATEGVEIAKAWGATWPLGTALRAAGIAEGGSGGIDLMRQSVATLEDTPARLELARALVDLGSALRRHGTLGDARVVLRRGMDLAHRCGAIALLERSRDELNAAGARPRRYVVSGVDALTPAEGRVARLAADGRTNKEIAQSLFVTPKAVEFHLANAYRKLAIGSRQELPGALEKSA